MTINILEPIADTFINQAAASTNYGTQTTIDVGKVASTTSKCRGLLKFDLSNYATTDFCNSATLQFCTKTDYAAYNSYWYVYIVKKNWVETEATWNSYASGASWSTAGGMGTDDIYPTYIGSVSVKETFDAGTLFSIPLLATEVQKIISGSYTNYGFLIQGGETANSISYKWGVGSREFSVSGSRPLLTLETYSQNDLYGSFNIQPSVADTYINSYNTTSNFGTNSQMYIGFTSGDANRALVKFNMPIYSPSAVFDSVNLGLTIQFNGTTSGSTAWEVFRLKRDWQELQSTWNGYASGGSWQTAGALGANDIDLVPIGVSGTISVAEPVGTRINIPISACVVRKMADGIYPNYGFLVKSTIESQTRRYGIYTREYITTASYCPILTINSHEEDGTPYGTYDQYTKALLHFDGDNGSHYFRDELQNIWTPYRYPSISGSGPYISTTEKKFGTGSGYFAGSAVGNWIETPTQFNFGSQDWTCDFWIRPNPDDEFCGSFGFHQDSNNYWGTGIWSASGLHFPVYYERVSGSFISHWYDGDIPIEIDVWQHLAYVKSGSYIVFFVNGTKVTNGFPCSSTMPTFSAQRFKIGGVGGQYGSYRGYMDEFRLSIGIKRWTSNFTPPTAPYAPYAPVTAPRGQPFMYSSYPWI